MDRSRATVHLLALAAGTLAGVGVLAAPATARGESEPILAVPVPAPDPPPPPDPPGVRSHDGFYLRFGFGVGTLLGSARLDGQLADLSGSGPTVDLAIGGSPAPGLAFGGAVLMGGTPSLTPRGRSDEDATYPLDGLSGASCSAGVFGPFLDYYPLPRIGLHVEVALGVGIASADYVPQDDVAVPQQSLSGTGFGAALETGYELWIGEQWSLGALARLLIVTAKLHPEGQAGTEPEVAMTVLSPGASLVATYH